MSFRILALSYVLLVAASQSAAAAPTVVTINSDGVFLIDGKPAFPIGFSEAPPPDGVTPAGHDAYAELASNGAVFHRCRAPNWPATEPALAHMLDRSAKSGILCGIYIPRLTKIPPDDIKTEAELRNVVAKYRAHSGLGYWKGADEPELARVPVEQVQKFYDVVHELDESHPVWITQAPRGTLESLRRYNPAYDVGAVDIYPVSYPPGAHSDLPNKNISVVGDYAARMQEAMQAEKPLWMVLQICWSGVSPARGKTLRFPTFAEERYMTYQAIINGARGLTYFGGDVTPCLNPRDAELGWNWTFYYRVLKPVLRELSPASPLFPALIAPDSGLPVSVEGANDLEFLVREAPDQIFILAAKREGATMRVRFSGLPPAIAQGDVLFEAPRKVTVSDGTFTDWFGPNEVHVYRFRTPNPGPKQARAQQ